MYMYMSSLNSNPWQEIDSEKRRGKKRAGSLLASLSLMYYCDTGYTYL